MLILTTQVCSQSDKIVTYQVEAKSVPIAYDSMKIYGLLGERMDLNIEKVLAILPYYSYTRAYTPGVEAFWPAGEYLGKFAQALMNSYLYTGNQRYIEQTQKIIDTWVDAQAPDGYVATNPDGYMNGARWNFWAVWDHKYTLLGLLDYYAISGEKRVLEAARKIGDLIINEFGPGYMKRDLMESGHSGMVGGSILEPMTYLYQFTGEERYLDFCYHILNAYEQSNGPQIISELTERSGHVHKIGHGKGYEMISCIIGILRMYQLTGKETFLLTAEKAWQDIVENNLYVTGTATQGELFFGNKHLPADETIPISDHPWGLTTISMGEGCVTAHWIFLNRLLFELSNDLKYIEEIEKSLYNHLLGSQSAKTGQQSYFTALIGHKNFRNFNTYGGSPPCCLSSVQRCISRIPEKIWSVMANKGISILIYNSGEFSQIISTPNNDQTLVNLTVNENILESGSVKINLQTDDPASFILALRVPSWVQSFTAQIPGDTTYIGMPGEYLFIDRKWSGKDELFISMHVLDQIIEGSPTYKGYYAFKHGPYILALDQELNKNIDIDNISISNINDVRLIKNLNALPAEWLGNQAYIIETNNSEKLVLTPFLDSGQLGSKYRVWIPGNPDRQ
jgi:uncharacterized protein